MEIVLISDGPLSIDSPARKLPFFFAARLVDMASVSERTVVDAKIAVLELQDATEAGLKALKASWKHLAAVPVICLVDEKSRRETIQAAALGNSELCDRDTPIILLLKRINGLVNEDLCAALPENAPAQTVEAYRQSNVFLQSLCLSAVEGSPIQVNLLNDSADELLASLSLNGLSSWLEAVHTHHSGTYSHSLMVAGVAGMFAIHLGWPEEECREVIAGGLVHDIGKMRIPLSILDKPGKLTEEERKIVNKHPLYGRDILKPRLEVSVGIKKMAMQHHEYLDGSGYPLGLDGSRISAQVRLMTISDIFSALTETRAYKDGVPVRVAIDILRKMGPKLDQNMLSSFADMVLKRDLGDVKRTSAHASGGAAA
ncbi:HD-GYP domain-containing protein [Roseibium marinum]|uniref:Putative nucleotidyltransferase with HDIG domain n=1 Tax=Roseibium marinum TaxID=281252 RepID=A0A2S3UQ26_9HYPH|nr:HD domain-containing phosphohydrolase [Roseibium marinum]POF29825.1 putative nucleotidyltransferase with HDIG domain [Roseibium marinum]